MSTRKFSISNLIIDWIAQLLYLSALTALIPVILLVLISPVETLANLSEYVSMTALGLMAISFFMLLLARRSIGHVLVAWGWMTVIPGIGGLIFLVFNKEAIVAFFSAVFSWLPFIKPVVGIIENSFPNLWFIVISYIVIGFFMLHIAGKLEHKHVLSEQIKRLFGKRARILKSH